MITESEILDRARILMISQTVSAKSVTARELETGNRIAFNEAIYAAGTANYLWTRKNVKTVAIVYRDHLYGQSFSKRFNDGFKNAGGKVAAIAAIPPIETDSTMTLCRIAPTKPHWLLSISGVKDLHQGIVLQKKSGGLADSVLVLAGLSNGADF